MILEIVRLKMDIFQQVMVGNVIGLLYLASEDLVLPRFVGNDHEQKHINDVRRKVTEIKRNQEAF